MNLGNMAEIISIISIFLIVYPFVIYPLILKLLSFIFNNKVTKNFSFKGELTVLIAAYNEEDKIVNCINSIYNSNYPKDKINVLIGSDGSNDNTHSLVEELMKKHSSLNYFIYQRRGKNVVLNKLIKNVKTEFIYFLDADCRVESETFNHLIANFISKDVGAAFSPLKIVSKDNNSGGSGEKYYQNFELFLRYYESKISSPVNSFGALMMRVDLFSSIPNSTVCDDFYHILSIISKKKRVIFDTDTYIYEVRDKSLSDEFFRRKRLTSGGLATMYYFKKLFLPQYGLIPFFLISHKLSKWLSPFYLIILFISTLLLNDSLYKEILMMGQVILYISALIAWFLEKTNFKIFIFKIPLFFVSMNLSLLLGWFRFFSGKQNAIWDRSGLVDN